MSRYLRPHAWAIVPALFLLCMQNALPQAPPVEDLQCVCEEDGPTGDLRVRLTWQNPVDASLFEIRRDVEPPFQIPATQPAGGREEYIDSDPLLGVHQYAVVLIDSQGMRSNPVHCDVECPPLPDAIIHGPGRLVLPPAVFPPQQEFMEFILDGRESTDGFGGAALRYRWSPAGGDADIDIVSPFAAVTRVRIRPLLPATFVAIQLQVQRAPDFNAQDQEIHVIQLVEPGTVPNEPPQLFAPPRDFLVAVAGQEFRLPLMVEFGVPYPDDIQFLAPEPAGFGVDLLLGEIVWTPLLSDAGRDHVIEFLADNGEPGAFPGLLQIRVVPPGSPVLMYAFPIPGGGGGTLGPAPGTIPDQGSAQPEIGLQLSPLAPGTECAVQLITADVIPGHPFDGVLFDPACVPSASGLYFTAAPSGGLLPAGANDFSLEVWVSNVGTPPAGRGYIFSNSEGSVASGINWLLAHDGVDSFAVDVKVDATVETLSVTASPRPDGLTQLVFVRRGDAHELYVNGSFVVGDPAVAPADLVAGWDADYPITLGNSDDETRPFEGNLHLAVFYDTALSANLISYLDEIGSGVPTDVPPPVADICPDPGEIRRIVEADGSQSHSLLGAGAGAGATVGTGDGCPDMLIPPFLWEVFPQWPTTTTVEAVPDPDGCALETEISYAIPPESPDGRFDLTIRLTVTQVPVRGVVETGMDEKTITLPTYFRRGNVNGDEFEDLSDAVAVLDMLFVSGTPLPCLDACDMNDDGGIDLSDPVYWLAYLFNGGPEPDPPFSDCGEDPTDDSEAEPINGDLGCAVPPGDCG